MIYTKKLGGRTLLVFYIRKSLNIHFPEGGITDYDSVDKEGLMYKTVM